MPSDAINDGIDPTSRPHGDLVEINRSIIAIATQDSLDQPVEYIADAKEHIDESNMSIASTVDVDNTSCYLKRFADKFAHEKQKPEEVHTMFVKINKYKMGQEVIYGNSDRAIIVDVYYEDNNLPRYNIELSDKYVEAHVGEDQLARLDKTKDGSQFENSRGRMPRISTLDSQSRAGSKVVDFDSSTLLFSHLYIGEYQKATSRLLSHPEEASIWVVRYHKPDAHGRTGAQLHKCIRWKLLPLHLLVILSGSHVYINGREEGTIPPLELFRALLEACPRATKCIDDQHMIPLHASIRSHSSPCIIQALVDASPESVIWKDIKGRDAFVLLEQVFKRLMNQAVINADVDCETDDALKIRKWKQDVLHILSDAAKHDQDSTQPANIFHAKHQPTEDKSPKSVCKELGDAKTKYLQLCISSNESASTQDITPCSTMTPTSTSDKDGQVKNNEDGMTTMHWEARCRMLEMESYDSEDRGMDYIGTDAAVTILDHTTSSSIFRSRESHQKESVVRRSNRVTDSSDSNISQLAAENKGGGPKGAHESTFDSSMILTAMFSYEDDDEDRSKPDCSDAFTKDALEMSRQGAIQMHFKTGANTTMTNKYNEA